MIVEFSGDFLQQLRGFYYAAVSGSMVKAAKMMNRSQSSVSRLVHQLELSLEVMLFYRKRDGVKLTSEGSKIFNMAVRVFEQLSLIRAESGNDPESPSGPVSIIAGTLLFRRFINPLLPELYELYPGLELDLREGIGVNRTFSEIENYCVDFAFMVKSNFPSEMSFQPMFSTSMALIVPKKMKIRLDNPISWEELATLPYVALPQELAMGRYLSEYIKNGVTLRNIHMGSTQLLQLAIVQAGYGVAIADSVAAKLYLDDPESVDLYPLDHLLPKRIFGIVMRKDGYLTPQAQAALNFFKQRAETL